MEVSIYIQCYLKGCKKYYVLKNVSHHSYINMKHFCQMCVTQVQQSYQQSKSIKINKTKFLHFCKTILMFLSIEFFFEYQLDFLHGTQTNYKFLIVRSFNGLHSRITLIEFLRCIVKQCDT